MARVHTALLLYTLTVFTLLANGYFIDPSCDGRGDKMSRGEITRAMASVHRLATSAIATMGEIRANPTARRDASGTVRQEAFVNFLGNLVNRYTGVPDPTLQGFADTGTVLAWVREQAAYENVPGRSEPLPEPRSKDPTNENLPELRYGALDRRHVVIFCDTRRFDFRSEPGYSIDRATGYKNRETEEELRDRERLEVDRHGRIREFEAAWTYNPKKRHRRGMFRYPVSVQLNPNLRRYHEIYDNVDKLYTNLQDWYPRQRRKNSFMSTLDQILLHEMLHTQWNPEILIEDDGGYYWDQCLASSRDVGWENADNITIFAFLTALARAPGLDYGRSGIPRRIR